MESFYQRNFSLSCAMCIMYKEALHYFRFVNFVYALRYLAYVKCYLVFELMC